MFYTSMLCIERVIIWVTVSNIIKDRFIDAYLGGGGRSGRGGEMERFGGGGGRGSEQAHTF